VSDTNHHNSSNARDYRIPAGAAWAQAWKMAAVVGVLGLAAAAYGYTVDPRRFAFSYLMGFVTVLTIAFGSLFFVLIQHLTGAGWSVTVRRTSEFFVAGIVIVPLLALPNLLGKGELFPWWHHGQEETVAHAQEPTRVHVGQAHENAPAANHAEAEAQEGEGHGHGPLHALEENTMAKKVPYLNSSFFFIRAVLYFLAWLWLGERLFRYSTAQDASGDPKWTVKLQRLAPGATFVFAITLTFAAFDWIMGLQPTWYSTMFGVRIFAASAVLGLAINILVALGLRNAGVVKNEISVEHLHDLGKLMFAFLIFWAYISFSEFFLIWYAAIPEETVYYHMRWDSESWRMLSVSIVAVKFIIPFFLTMSRNVKRNPGVLGLGAAWIVVMHLVEMYYWVMPYYGGADVPFTVSGLMTDVGGVLGCVGIYLAVVFRRMLNHPVIPVRDPRLSRALNFVNA
jgi:hypothetical protein